MRGERARELKVLHERQIIRTYAYLANVLLVFFSFSGSEK